MTAPAPLFQWHTYTPGHYDTPPAPPPPPPPTAPVVGSSLVALAPLPAQRGTPTLAVLGGKVYAAGGEFGSTGPTTLYVYDPATNTWSTRAPLPVPRERAAGDTTLGGKLYIPGGADALGTSVSTLYVYDPDTDSWTTRAALPYAVQVAAIGVVGGKLYVAGGNGSVGSRLPRLLAYDPAANTWATLADMPNGLHSAAAAAVGGKLYVSGGNGTGSIASLTTLYAYDPATNTWATRAPMPLGRQSHTMVAGADGRLYVYGGRKPDAFVATTVDAYDPATDTWTTLAGPVGGELSSSSAATPTATYFVAGNNTANVYRLDVVAGTTPEVPPAPVPVWVPGGYALDAARSAALVSWSVAYGRGDAFARTTPLEVTVALDAGLAGACPVGGDRFRLALDAAHPAAVGLTADQRARFSGEVTDAAIDPKAGLYTITAVGRLGRARRRTLNGTGWPRELDGARVSRILSLAGRGITLGTIDAGASTLIAATSSAQGVGALLDLVVDSTGGQIIEQPTGAIDYHDADHRRGAPVALTLTPAEILNELVWSQHVGDIVNEVEVAYGPLGDRVAARDRDSILALEEFPTSITTALATSSDAYDIGNLLTARRSTPRWQLPNLLLDLRATVTPAKAAALLKLRHGDRIAVDALPVGGPYTGRVELFVEGLVEVATRRAWTLAIAVSDPRLSGVGVRWKDVSAALTWDGVKPALTWLDTALLENPADLAT